MSPDPRIALVVAVARNGVIGRDGGLAWRISDDLKWFKTVTMGKPVIMGRKTWESIGRPLPGRVNIVVSRDRAYTAPGAIVDSLLDAALDAGKQAACENNVDEICIIGGGEIYRALLPRADRIYLTEVDAAPEGDAFFPALDPSAWTVQKAGGAQKGEKNDHACEFLILDRRLTDVTNAGDPTG